MDDRLSSNLPAGLSASPLTPDDLHAVYELERVCQANDEGEAAIDLSDIEAGWRRPDFDLATMTCGVFADRALIGYAEVFNGRAEAAVLPEQRGRGIGRWLAHRTWSMAHDQGWDSVGQTISDGAADARELFTSLGYRAGHESWVLRIDLAQEPESPALPRGLRFHAFAPTNEDRAVFDVIDPAFNEWPDRVSEGFENWREEMLHRDEVRPELVVLIADGDRLVGAAIGFDYGPGEEGWIQQVAVENAYRGRGLGRALLQESFRRFWMEGRRTVGLSTDSRTGALGLYLEVGMEVRSTYTRMTKDLSPAAEPA